MVCQRCGEEIPPTESRRGQYNRKWCSETCRKRACAERHRRPCPDCGEPMAEGSAWSSSEPRERCESCHLKREAMAWQARLEDVAAMYNEGMTLSEIAVMLGYKPTSHPPEITYARQAGLLTSYRYDETRRENMRAGREAAKERRAA